MCRRIAVCVEGLLYVQKDCCMCRRIDVRVEGLLYV